MTPLQVKCRPPAGRLTLAARAVLAGVLAALPGTGPLRAAGPAPAATASSSAPHSTPQGALDGDRLGGGLAHAWHGRPGAASWWWQVRFPEARSVGAILQIHGDGPTWLRNAPRRYIWQASADGQTWSDLTETRTEDERRTFRLHRLRQARTVRFLRLLVHQAEGDHPVLREVEFFATTDARAAFPSWAVVVSTTGEAKVPGAGGAFISLARSCPGWESLQFQQVWLGDFNEAFLAAEPRPLCAFLSGNFIDWCQQKREDWRGTQGVLRAGRLPMWASCGGAQGMAILAETGVDRPWDCPQCRDPASPKLPIYTHIAGSRKRACGDYSGCIFERGPYQVRQVRADPVFAGLPREFRVIESHCGQIEWPPRDWVLVAAGGPGSLTRTQCLRVKDRYIYAAQFHIEMDGAPATARAIMGNFLRLARQWGGYNPEARPVAEPPSLSTSAP
jgi:hypothetical protein